MKNYTAILSLISAAGLLACDGDFNGEYRITAEKAHLAKFRSCAEFQEARTYRPGSGSDHAFPLGAPEAQSARSGDANSGQGAAAMPGESNTQVAGVDENDMVKADGDFIYRLSSMNVSKLQVIRRAPASSAGVIQSLVFGDGHFPTGLYVTQDQVVALISKFGAVSAAPARVGLSFAEYDSPIEIRQETNIVIYDRAADGTLSKKLERTISGSLSHSRLVDRRLHLVLSQHIGAVDLDTADRSPIEPLLPVIDIDSQKEALASCEDVWHEIAVEDAGVQSYSRVDNMIGVLTFDLDKPEEKPKGEWIAGHAASLVYASKENLFLASYGWDLAMPIHQFKLAKEGKDTHYVGTALLNGYLLSQFSMDEHDGYFRVAATDTTGWSLSDTDGDGIVPAMAKAPGHSVYTFKLTDGDPKPAGKIEALAQGEQMYAVRFMGKTGYVVTFRQVDPLFVIDLRDQENPIVKGELKVPGFSNYLHPMAEGYLLGIGQSATEAGRVKGMALSIFDVRDVTSPKLAHKIEIGSLGTSSEAQYNHHAFRYVPETGQLILPIQMYGEDHSASFRGFQIYQASLASGFSLLGQSAFAQNSYEYISRAFVRDGMISMIGGGELVLRNSTAPAVDVRRIAIDD